MPSMQKRPENKNLALSTVLMNPTTLPDTSMDRNRVEEAARQRAKLEKADMQRRARAQAVHEYVTGPALDVAANPPVTPVERKRTMRNKSAFISRQTQRHYQRFLSDHIRNAEMERDAAWRQKQSIEEQITVLRNLERQLQNGLSATAAPSAPERPRNAGSSSRMDAMRGVSSGLHPRALRSRSTAAGDARFHAPATTYATALPQSTATSTTMGFSGPPTTYTQGVSRPASTTAALTASFGIPSSYGGRPRGAPNISTGFTAPNLYEAAIAASFPMSAGYAPSVSRATSNTGFDALFDASSGAHYNASTPAPSSFAAPTRAGAPRARGGVTTASTHTTWSGSAANLISSSSLPVSSAAFPTADSTEQEMFYDEFGDWAAPQTTPSQPPTSRQDSYP